MRQALVEQWGQPPKWVSVPEPSAPGPNEVRIKLIASGAHRVVRSRAAGKHYSSGKPPHVPGIDGVGTTDDGKTVYFMSFGAPIMSEYFNMPKHSIFPLSEGLDPVQAAGALNPAMSSWMAFKSRTTNLPEDFSVLVLGATSASGRVAIPLARSLGAKRIIGAARNRATLDTLGLDESVVISENVEQTDFSKLGDVDVVIDYIYGPLAVHLFKSLKSTKPVQYVHIGALSGLDIDLPGAVLRSKNLAIRGSGPGAWDVKELMPVMPDLLEALKTAPPQPIRVAKLEDVETEWTKEGAERLVFVP